MVTPEQNTQLRAPFGPEHVGKLPKGGTTLDYVGHGAVTDRLLEVDPEWNWEPLMFDSSGMPAFVYDDDLHPIALWIRLTVGGVTRLGVGTCPAKQFDAEKVLIGDALRNAAMRFGVALDLWIRGQAEDDEQVAAADPRQARGRRAPGSKELRNKLAEIAKRRDELSAPALARLIKFAQDEGLPDPERLNLKQADKVLEWLGQQTEAAKLPKSGSGGATDREAVDTPTEPADAGRADVDTPPEPSTEGTLV
jgi:hypothetical protein